MAARKRKQKTKSVNKPKVPVSVTPASLTGVGIPGPHYKKIRPKVLEKLAKYAALHYSFRNDAKVATAFEDTVDKELKNNPSAFTKLNDQETAACIGWAELAAYAYSKDKDLKAALQAFSGSPTG